MPKHFIYGIIGLIIGLAVGFMAANSINRSALTAGQPVDPTTLPTQGIADSANSSAVPGAMPADVQRTLDRAKDQPQDFVAQMKAGDMYAQIGRFEQAIEYYKKGLALDPGNFNANVVLANAYFDSRQFEQAAEYYSKALEIKPDAADARTDLGATLVERPNPDLASAISEFEKVLEANPKHEPALYYLAIAYKRKGDQEQAQKTLGRLESANPTSELVTRLRQNLQANGS